MIARRPTDGPMTVFRETVKVSDGLDFVLSDNSVDRLGDIVEATGWNLANFKKNPIALFGHSTDFPIGTWENIKVDGDRLVARLKLAVRGTSARIDELISLVEQNILRAVSVGFRPLKSEPLDPDKPNGGQRFLKQELLEASLVAVPANPQAMQLAKSLKISDETMSLAFGEHAGTRRRDVTANGEHAVDKTRTKRKPSMRTLSQRIEDAQNDLNIKRDKLVELEAMDDPDLDAIEEVQRQVEQAERLLASRKASERLIGTAAGAPDDIMQPPESQAPAAPAVRRSPFSFRQADVKPSDLIIRKAVCNLLAYGQRKPIEHVLEERYPGHEATAVVTKTDIVVADSTTSGWASQLLRTAVGEFYSLLQPFSIYPALRDMGLGLTFGPNSGAIKIPFETSNTAMAGGFVLEGDPIKVGRLTLDSITLSPHKFGIIVPMTREIMRLSNPALEDVVRQSLLSRTAITLDGLLLDATASSTTRPPGLLNGVSVAGSVEGGGDYVAFLNDIKTLLAPFDSANAGRKLALIMNPAQARHVRMMPGPVTSGFGWANQFFADFAVLTSTSCTSGTIIAVDTADFVTGTGDAPEFEVSEQATIHMSDTPLEIVSGTGPATADPVRSMFQTNSVALRMIMNITWAMRRTGMVQYLSGVSW